MRTSSYTSLAIEGLTVTIDSDTAYVFSHIDGCKIAARVDLDDAFVVAFADFLTDYAASMKLEAAA